ncbi:hypothetical protein F5883DRAFT_563846 [Diaporthe sp. PMI_573]|nr:hypothetical protein F5883DRAFT_563846 [Diaporthaceae sp. PMI_573]
MSEYTSTREGFQRAMKWALTGPPDEVKKYAEAVTTPTFYHIMDGQRLSYDENIKRMEEWSGRSSQYEPVVHDFLRDGDMLAARMTGTLKIEGMDSEFETFFVAKVDSAGKMLWLKDRSLYGPVGEVIKKDAN